MKTRFATPSLPSLRSTSIVLGVFASTYTLPVPALARVPQGGQPTAASVAKARRNYIKAVPSVDGSIGAAQTAIRRFTPIRGNGPSVYLVAAIHIGEKSYYQQLQQFLDKQSVVLCEGIRPPRNIAATKTKSVRTARPTASRAAKPSTSKLPVSLYEKFSNALHLQFQLDGIRYNRPHFYNSDLDWDAMHALAVKAGPDTQQRLGELRNTISGGPSLTDSARMLDKVLTFSASTPLVATMLRRLLVSALCEPEKLRALLGLKAQKGGALAPATKLDTIIIQERNKVVLADLRALLTMSKQAPGSIQSIAVFYGAAHMKDMEQHLVSDLGYRGAEVQWITAIQAR